MTLINLHISEFRFWLKLALPSALRSTADLLPWLITLTMVGRLGTFELSALSLTETMIYTSMVVVWNCVSKSQSTLISQAQGAKNVTAMRGWALLSFIAMLILSSFVAILWFFSNQILILAGFDALLVRKGYEYTLWAIPSLFLNAFNLTSAVYLSCMQCPGIPLLIALISCIFDTAITYWFLFILKLDLAGAAQTWSITTVISLICNIFALKWALTNGRELEYGEEEINDTVDENNERGLTSRSDESLSVGLLDLNNNNEKIKVHYEFKESLLYIMSKKQWYTFLSQLFPNFVSDLFANSQYQAVSLMAASLGALQIAAHNGALAILEVSLTISTGMAEATAIRVGYHLGRKDTSAAKRTVIVAICFGSLIGLIIASIGFGLKSYLGRFFTDDVVVVSVVESLALYFWLYFFVVTVSLQFLAVLEGQGRAQVQSGIFLLGGWAVGVPLAIASMKLTHFGLPALWASLLIGDVVTAIFGAFFVWRSNWSLLAEEATYRQEEDQ